MIYPVLLETLNHRKLLQKPEVRAVCIIISSSSSCSLPIGNIFISTTVYILIWETPCIIRDNKLSYLSMVSSRQNKKGFEYNWRWSLSSLFNNNNKSEKRSGTNSQGQMISTCTLRWTIGRHDRGRCEGGPSAGNPFFIRYPRRSPLLNRGGRTKDEKAEPSRLRPKAIQQKPSSYHRLPISAGDARLSLAALPNFLR